MGKRSLVKKARTGSASLFNPFSQGTPRRLEGPQRNVAREGRKHPVVYVGGDVEALAGTSLMLVHPGAFVDQRGASWSFFRWIEQKWGTVKKCLTFMSIECKLKRD